jgi:hypothetical protein
MPQRQKSSTGFGDSSPNYKYLTWIDSITASISSIEFLEANPGVASLKNSKVIARPNGNSDFTRFDCTWQIGGQNGSRTCFWTLSGTRWQLQTAAEGKGGQGLCPRGVLNGHTIPGLEILAL